MRSISFYILLDPRSFDGVIIWKQTHSRQGHQRYWVGYISLNIFKNFGFDTTRDNCSDDYNKP